MLERVSAFCLRSIVVQGEEALTGLMQRLIVLGIKIDRSVSGKACRLGFKDGVALSIVCMNLLSCVDGETVLLYSRDTGGLTSEWKDNPKGVSAYRIVKAVDWLEQQEYVVNTRASAYQLYNDGRKLSFITPTQKFIDKFNKPGIQEQAIQAMRNAMPVLVVRVNGVDINWRNTKQMAHYEKAMRMMNDNNSQYIVVNEDDKQIPIEYWRTFLEHLESNGRMYTLSLFNIENKRSKGRLKIKINGMDIVEVDYNAMHLRLLADRHGMSLPAGDAYNGMLHDGLKTGPNRDVLKQCVIRLLNCSSRASAMLAFREPLETVQGHTFKNPSDVMLVIDKGLVKLTEHLYTDKLGMSLTYTESCIMSDVIDMFVALGKPILPVHDSAIVLHQDSELLAQAMGDYYRKHTETSGIVTMTCSRMVDGELVKTDVSC